MLKARYTGSPTEFLSTGKTYEIEVVYGGNRYCKVRVHDKNRVLFKWLPSMEYANKSDFLSDWRMNV